MNEPTHPDARPSALDSVLERVAAEHGMRLTDRVGMPTDHEQVWSSYDWSRKGEEWGSPTWLKRFLSPWLAMTIVPGIRIVEIGPGAGRLTELLLGEGREVVLVDVSRKCLDQTLARFPAERGLRAVHIGTDRLETAVAPESVDLVISWDCFVHLDYRTTADYVKQFRRVLKPGAHGLIHHADTRKAGGWRGDVNLATFIDLLVHDDCLPLAHVRAIDAELHLLGHYDYVTFFRRGLEQPFAERLLREQQGGRGSMEIEPL